MITLLKKATEFNLFSSLDIQFAIRLTDDENSLLLLIFAILSAETRAGHVCLFIDKLEPAYLFEGRQVEMVLCFGKWQDHLIVTKFILSLNNVMQFVSHQKQNQNH